MGDGNGRSVLDREAVRAPRAGRDAGGVTCIHADRSVAEAVQRLRQSGGGALIVTDGDGAEAAVVGLLTERDIWRALAARGPEVLGSRVWVVVEPDFPEIDIAASIDARMRVFCDRKVDHIALMDGFRVRAILNIWDCASQAAGAHDLPHARA